MSEEGLVRRNCDVVLEDVENQLIDDAELELVATDMSDVPSCIESRLTTLCAE